MSLQDAPPLWHCTNIGNNFAFVNSLNFCIFSKWHFCYSCAALIYCFFLIFHIMGLWKKTLNPTLLDTITNFCSFWMNVSKKHIITIFRFYFSVRGSAYIVFKHKLTLMARISGVLVLVAERQTCPWIKWQSLVEPTKPFDSQGQIWLDPDNIIKSSSR